MYKNYYNPEQGLTLLSIDGGQRISQTMNAATHLLTELNCGAGGNRFSVDSAWLTGDLYYADYDHKCVKKIRYTGEELAKIDLKGPRMVSVVRNTYVMSKTIEEPIPEDRGCWILDYVGTRILRTDKFLQEQVSIRDVFKVVGLRSTPDDGCVFASNSRNRIVKLDRNANVEAYITYANIDGSWTGFRDMAVDQNGLIYLATDKNIYVYGIENGGFYRVYAISPIVNETQDFIGAIDVDISGSSPILYVTGGTRTYGWIAKYDSAGSLIKRSVYDGMVFPFILRVVQSYGSDGLYVLVDQRKWEEYDYGSSSSSSSSSSSIDSSSTSSSTSSRDSSSSSTENYPWLAHDDAADIAYPGPCINGWCTGDDGGFGWPYGWVLSTFGTTGMAGHWLDVLGRGGLICTSNRSWGLWAYSDQMSDAKRYFPHAMRPDELLSLKFRHGPTDNIVGFELMNPVNEMLFAFYSTSGWPSYSVEESRGRVDIGIPVSENGVKVEFFLIDKFNYRIMVQHLDTGDRYFFDGYVITSTDYMDIRYIRLVNYGSGSNPNNDIFFNDINLYRHGGSSSSGSSLSSSSESIGNISSSSSSISSSSESIGNLSSSSSSSSSSSHEYSTSSSSSIVLTGYIVSGAGSTNFNGTYCEYGEYGGKTYWRKVGGTESIFWGAPYGPWYIGNPVGTTTNGYLQTTGGSSPYAGAWSVSGGSMPSPTTSYTQCDAGESSLSTSSSS